MNKTDIVTMANRYFLALEGADLPNLIRRIQTAQGNSPCFATGKQGCELLGCQWYRPCKQEGAPEPDAGAESTSTDHD